MKFDSIITKIRVLMISIIFILLVILTFFLDEERLWGFEKIMLCVVASIFTFFFPPTVKYIIN